LSDRASVGAVAAERAALIERRDHYRDILQFVTDARARAVLEDCIREIETQIAELFGR
jgi:hypothetical protein